MCECYRNEMFKIKVKENDLFVKSINCLFLYI